MPCTDVAASEEQAAARALDFLLAARNWAGWWTDFRLAPGFSDEWATGYVGSLLAAGGGPQARAAITAAWALLAARHRTSGAWGYNMLTPGDADSTGWGLQLAHAAGAADSPRAAQGRACLEAHLRPGGGVATYATDGPIRRFINAAPDQSLGGWCSAHVCVSAAVAHLAEFRDRVAPYLRATQQPDGGWRSYWWQDHEYATALAAAALAGGAAEDRARVDGAVRWGIARVGEGGAVASADQPEGSPFAAAWCLRLLLLGDSRAAAQAAAAVRAWLLVQQQADGSWPSSARLRVPQPDDLDPENYRAWVYGGRFQGAVVFDQHRVFSTATVRYALRAARSGLPGASSQE